MFSTEQRMTPLPQARTFQPIESAANPAALLRCATVQGLTGFSRSHIYARVAAGTFPEPIKFGTRCTRWRAGDVTQWLEAVK